MIVTEACETGEKVSFVSTASIERAALESRPRKRLRHVAVSSKWHLYIRPSVSDRRSEDSLHVLLLLSSC